MKSVMQSRESRLVGRCSMLQWYRRGGSAEGRRRREKWEQTERSRRRARRGMDALRRCLNTYRASVDQQES